MAAGGSGCHRICRSGSGRRSFTSDLDHRIFPVWRLCLVHELQAHGIYSMFQPVQLTPLPLAYGFFCAAFDFCMTVYFYAQRDEWTAARKAVPRALD